MKKKKSAREKGILKFQNERDFCRRIQEWLHNQGYELLETVDRKKEDSHPASFSSDRNGPLEIQEGLSTGRKKTKTLFEKRIQLF